MEESPLNTETPTLNTESLRNKRLANLTRKGMGRPKGARNRRTVFLEEMMPGLKDFLDNFPTQRQIQVKNYIGFRNLMEASQMVDGDELTDRPFSRRLQIVDRTLPRSQEVNVTQKHALITGKLETLLKIYDEQPNDNNKLEYIDSNK